MSQLTDGISSKESVLSTWTEAKGTSIQGDISLGLFDKSSTISEAVGLFVAVMFQHVFNKVSNCGLIPEGIVKVCPAFTCSITWLLLRPKMKKKIKIKWWEQNNWHLPTTVWPEQIWIKVRSWWQILPQHQTTYLRSQESASIEIPPFWLYFIEFSKKKFMK